jgi:hypothetical protein
VSQGGGLIGESRGSEEGEMRERRGESDRKDYQICSAPPSCLQLLPSNLYHGRKKDMMVATGVPFKEFKGIREGDFIFDDEIIHLYKGPYYMKIHTKSGAVYTVHNKPWGYNIFKRTKVNPRKKKRTYEEKIDRRYTEPLMEIDTLGRFIRDRCVQQEGVSVQIEDLIACYQEWCQSNNEYVCTEQYLIRRLEDLGHEEYKIGRSRWWGGIGVRNK